VQLEVFIPYSQRGESSEWAPSGNIHPCEPVEGEKMTDAHARKRP
jgi:hypothetical protein